MSPNGAAQATDQATGGRKQSHAGAHLLHQERQLSRMDLEQARQTSDIKAEHPTLGKPDAKVVLRYYSDFQCPFCRDFERSDAHRRLQEDHIEGGNVRLEFIPFPVLGPDSVTAAQAAHYVWRNAPQVYWAWHKAMYDAQGPENTGWASKEKIVEISRQFDDLDDEGLRGALDSEEYEPQVRHDVETARANDIHGTPTLMLNDKRVEPDRVHEAVASAVRDA